jgi:hypothetical protein
MFQPLKLETYWSICLHVNLDIAGESRVQLIFEMAMRDDEDVRGIYGIAPSDDPIEGPKATDPKNSAVVGCASTFALLQGAGAERVPRRRRRDNTKCSPLVPVSVSSNF